VQAQASPQNTISGVQIAWSDSTHTNVKITWNESAATANKVGYTLGESYNYDLGTATSANQLVVPASAFNDADRAYSDGGRIVKVFVGDATGANRALSVGFDTWTPSTGVSELSFGPHGTVIAKITGDRTAQPDATPGDPLDLTGTQRFVPHLTTPGGGTGCGNATLPTTAARQVTIPTTTQPTIVEVSGRNEWGTHSGALSYIATTNIGISAPASVKKGATATITGPVTVTRNGVEPANDCSASTSQDSASTVYLQARANSTSAWTTIVTGKPVESGPKATYKFAVQVTATKQYRAVYGNLTEGWLLQFGSASPVVPDHGPRHRIAAVSGRSGLSRRGRGPFRRARSGSPPRCL
jgi:hypothetical protein